MARSSSASLRGARSCGARWFRRDGSTERQTRTSAMNDDEIRKRVRERLANGSLQRSYHIPMAPLKPGEPVPSAMLLGSALTDPCVVCDERSTQTRYNTMPPAASHARCNDTRQAAAEK